MPDIRMIFECGLRSILISCGLQFAIFQLLDIGVIRHRRKWPAYLFMLCKTFLIAVTSIYVSSHDSTTLQAANTLLNMLITAIVYWMVLWTWSDEPLHTLLVFTVSEHIAGTMTVIPVGINLLEGRPAMELAGPLHPLDPLIPLLIFGVFFLLRPVFQKIMGFVARLYLPYRKVLWLFLLAYYIGNNLPAFVGSNISNEANQAFFAVFATVSIGCIIAILLWAYSQNKMIQKEMEAVSLQLKLIQKRAEITSRIRQEIEETRRTIGVQMKELELMAETGYVPSGTVEMYLSELQQVRVKESRGSYCMDPILDEILCEIQENAEAKGLKALISMSGYQPGKVTREDFSQLLYCIGFAVEGDRGTLELTITSSGDKLIIRMKAPQVHLSRMRSLLANRIVHAYGGSLTAEHMKDGQLLYIYLNSGKRSRQSQVYRRYIKMKG